MKKLLVLLLCFMSFQVSACSTPKQAKKQSKHAIQEQTNEKAPIKEATNKPEPAQDLLPTQGEYDVKITSMKASQEEETLRLDLSYIANEDGQVFIQDDERNEIGPIDIKKGESTLYFLLRYHNSNYQLRFVSKTNKTTSIPLSNTIIQEFIQKNKTSESDQ